MPQLGAQCAATKRARVVQGRSSVPQLSPGTAKQIKKQIFLKRRKNM